MASYRSKVIRSAGVAGVVVLTGVVGAGGASAAGGVSSTDKAFLVAAHASNQFEISSGRLAEAKAGSQTVRRLAAMFIADHVAGDAKGAAVAKAEGVSVPLTYTPVQLAGIKRLQAAAPGAGFDTAWLAVQDVSHVTSAAVAANEIRAGSAAAVTGLARAIQPVILMHLREVQAALRSAAPAAVGAGSGGAAATGSGLPAGGAVAALGIGLVLLLAGGSRLRRPSSVSA